VLSGISVVIVCFLTMAEKNKISEILKSLLIDITPTSFVGKIYVDPDMA
jgi:hypothetical protein